MGNPEILQPGSERGVEASDAAGEQLKKLQEQVEKRSEKNENTGEKLESARKETQAAFSKEAGRETKQGGEPSAPRTSHATKRQRKDSYEATMRQIRSEMGAPSRTFSKVIHNPAVEKVSEVFGNTAARPNAVLAGSVSATFLTLAIYLVAKHYGYRLSGFETIGMFLVGWLLGLVYDYTRIMMSGRRG